MLSYLELSEIYESDREKYLHLLIQLVVNWMKSFNISLISL